MRTVHLHGSLAAKYGGPFKLSARTAHQAARLLIANFPDIEDDFRDGTFRVVRGDFSNGFELDNESIEMHLGREPDLHFAPIIEGSGGGNDTTIKAAVKAVIGIALIATGVGAGAGGLALGSAIVLSQSTLILGGVGLLLASAAILLAPRIDNKSTKSAANNDSFLFTDGAINVSEQGVPVSLIYGEFEVGSNVISAGITTEQL